VVLGTESVPAYISYVLSAYTLTVWCVKLPHLIRFFKNFKNENKYARRWLDDTRLRVNVTLYASLAWNLIYAVLQAWLGYYHGSFWFYSMAIYYVCLSVMRLYLASYTVKNLPGENVRRELIRYRACGWIFLVMNLAFALMVFFMVYWGRTFYHHEITTITMAAYTFTSFTTAIVSVVKFRKYNSPVYSASKIISFTAASVSMVTLSSTMLTTFGKDTMGEFEGKLMLGLVGGAVAALVLTMAIYMIVRSTQRLRAMTQKEVAHGES